MCSVRKIESLLREHPNILNLWTKHSKLNEMQLEAVVCALKNKFQLIQGPPGECLSTFIVCKGMLMYVCFYMDVADSD